MNQKHLLALLQSIYTTIEVVSNDSIRDNLGSGSTRYDETMAKEEEFLETMMEVERVHQREMLLNKFKEHLPEDSEASGSQSLGE